MTLEEYFDKKNIDWLKFSQAEKALWQELKTAFEQMHHNSFEMRKKFILNKIRRKYNKAVP
ncbi:MAG: hypothetical protein ACK40K_08770 [Raineya sp.]